MTVTKQPDAASAESGGIQVISRAAAIMRALEGEADGLSLAEIAVKVGLPRSTVQRIVGALSAEGLLTAASLRARVRLGPGLVTLARTIDIATDRILRPVLVELARDCSETVDLSVLQGKGAIFVDQVTGAQRLVALSAVGETFPLYCTANGKALLAVMPVEWRQRVLSEKLAPLTPLTITDPAIIEAQIDEFQDTRLTWDVQEHAEGICAVGTAFMDSLGRPFAISIPVPVSRFEARAGALSDMLLKARAKCLRLLPGSHRFQTA